jgi:hypothetical protein
MLRNKQDEEDALANLSQPLSRGARDNESKVVTIKVEGEEDASVTFIVNWNVGVGGSIWAAGISSWPK